MIEMHIFIHENVVHQLPHCHQNLHMIENKSTHYFYRKLQSQAGKSANLPKARFLVSTI